MPSLPFPSSRACPPTAAWTSATTARRRPRPAHQPRPAAHRPSSPPPAAHRRKVRGQARVAHARPRPPPRHLTPPVPLPARPPGGSAPSGGMSPDSPLAFLATNPNFTQLRALVHQRPRVGFPLALDARLAWGFFSPLFVLPLPHSSPFLSLSPSPPSLSQLLPSLMQQLAAQNPQLVQLINANQEDFYHLINTPPGPMPGMGGMGGAPGGGQAIQVTPEENADIERLTEMGFDRAVAAQVRVAQRGGEGPLLGAAGPPMLTRNDLCGVPPVDPMDRPTLRAKRTSIWPPATSLSTAASCKQSTCAKAAERRNARDRPPGRGRPMVSAP